MNKILVVLTVLMVGTVVLLYPVSMVRAADPCDPGTISVNTDTTNDQAACLNQIPAIFGNIVSALTVIVEIVFFIMVLTQGYKFMVARGDPKLMGSARSGLMYSILGFVFVMIAYMIVVLIGNIVGFASGFGFVSGGQIQFTFP